MPRFIPLKSGMPSRGKRIARARSASLSGLVRVCVRAHGGKGGGGGVVMSGCVKSGARMPCFLFPLELFLSGQN